MRARGVTLLDTVVGVALMLIVFLGMYGVFLLSLDTVTNNKARAGAIALANERMEYLRSLSYTSVGVVGGIPSGNVAASESASWNGTNYTRRTLVRYADDASDGLAGSDSNSIVADYKEIRVEVDWQARTNTRSIVLVGRISPQAIESSVSGGTLSVTVVNAASAPVSGAQVTIANAGVSPAVNITTFTSAAGAVSFIGVPAATGYQITVSKNGYSSAQTYSASGQNSSPNPGHLTIVNNQTTSQTFGIDMTSVLAIGSYTLVGPTTTPLANLAFSMRGAKTIGTNGGSPVYKYNSSLSTGADSTTTLSNFEWDTYTISVDGAATGYDIAQSCPTQPFSLSPNSSASVSLILATHTTNSLLVDVKNNAGVLLPNASVRLYKTGYDTMIAADSCGQAFFSGLTSGTYSATISASGYTTYSSSNVNISGTSRLSIVLN